MADVNTKSIPILVKFNIGELSESLISNPNSYFKNVRTNGRINIADQNAKSSHT